MATKTDQQILHKSFKSSLSFWFNLFIMGLDSQ